MREDDVVHLLYIWNIENQNWSVFPFSGLNAFLYVAHSEVPQENIMLEYQDSVLKTQEQFKK